MSSDIAIRVEGLTKSFRLYERPEHRLLELLSFGGIQRHRTFTALKDVSLEIRRGETVGIVGRNGCGKSTLLQVICGILQPTAGTVTTQGRIAALLELGAGFDGNFTGRENVYLNGALHGRTRAEMEERIEAIIAFADIGEFIDRPVKTYSSGMFVRLAFATAVNVDPDILVVDEALAVGDEAFQRKCFARIEQIKERGATILFVSHAAQTIIQLCDRAVLMDGGEKLMEGTPKAVIGQYQRLANAAPQAAPTVRRAIMEGQPSAGGQQPFADIPSQFDTGLISQSRLAHEERGARIDKVRLVDLQGTPANVFTCGYRYAVTYDVTFLQAASDVGFGMFVTNAEGVIFGGAQSAFARHKRIAEIAAGTTIRVSLSFLCHFLPGTYGVTCTVLSVQDGERVMMHRIRDACLFRVSSLDDTIATGVINVEPELTYAILQAGD